MNHASNNQLNYIRQHKKKRSLIKLIRIGILFLFLITWELAVDTHRIDGFFFSSPSRIIVCIQQMASDGSLFSHIGITLLETIISFSLVIGISILFSTLLWTSNYLSDICEPYLIALNSLPKSALAPLFIVWLGTGIKTIIVAGISVSIFGSVIMIYTGFTSADREKIKLIKTLGGTKADAFLKVVLPSSLPTLLSSAKVNIGLSLVGVVIGEFLAARSGLGYLIIYGSQVFKLDMVIMSIFILCIISMLLYALLQMFEKKLRGRY